VTAARRLALVLVVGLAVLAVAVPPTGASAGSTAAFADGSGEPSVVGLDTRAATLQENNTTAVRHQDPDATQEDGDLSAVRRQLAGRMEDITIDCSQGIEVGNFDACEDLNGSYEDTLSKYVEVTGRDDEADEESAESYRQLGRETRELANETRRYRRTYREYQEARANGNTTRARRLARELRELNGDIQRTGSNISRASTDVENRTGVSLAPVEQSTRNVTMNVSTTANTVVTQVFVPTTLTANREGTGNISAREPLVVTGQIRTENGTRIGNGSVALATAPGREARVLNRTRNPVNESGYYRLSYRPTAIRTGNRTLSVHYRPAATSAFLPANETVDATVEGVRATLTLQAAPDVLRYNESVRTTGNVTVLGAESEEVLGPAGVPVRLRLDGRTLAASQTNASGELTVGPRLPAGISPGERTLSLVGPSSDRAVTFERVSRKVRVRSTETAIDVRAVQTATGERTVRVVGQLRARDAGVSGQDLSVRIGGRQVTTLETNATGYYRGTVTVPNASFPAAGSESATVVVTFDGRGTNLEDARAQRAVSIQGTTTQESRDPADRAVAFLRANPEVTGGIGLGAVGLLLVGFAAVRWGREEGGDVENAPTAATGAPTEAPADDAPSEVGGVGASLELAEAALSEGAYGRAVLAGYAAVQRGLTGAEGPKATTHWEFYLQAVNGDLSDAREAALREVTEAFEQVSFAGRTPGESEAAAVLAAARDVLAEDEGGGSESGRAADD
jgi:hypothetical protein